MMKKNKNILILLLIVFGLVIIYNIPKLFINKVTELPEVKLKNKIDKEKTMAIMISEDGKKYKEYERDTWPGIEYSFKKAECIDNKGNSVKNAIEFDEKERKAYLETEETVYCTLYFSYKGMGEEENPYVIQCIEDLVDLQEAVNNGETYAGKRFELKKDLDFNSEESYRDYKTKEYGDINGNGTDEELKTELTSETGWK